MPTSSARERRRSRSRYGKHSRGRERTLSTSSASDSLDSRSRSRSSSPSHTGSSTRSRSSSFSSYTSRSGTSSYSSSGRSRSRTRSRTPQRGTVKVCIKAISRNVTKEHLTEIFELYGRVAAIDIPVDRATGERRGIAYIDYETKQGAEAAKEHMGGGQIDGEPITVEFVLAPSRPKAHSPSRALPRYRPYPRRHFPQYPHDHSMRYRHRPHGRPRSRSASPSRWPARARRERSYSR